MFNWYVKFTRINIFRRILTTLTTRRFSTTILPLTFFTFYTKTCNPLFAKSINMDISAARYKNEVFERVDKLMEAEDDESIFEAFEILTKYEDDLKDKEISDQFYYRMAKCSYHRAEMAKGLKNDSICKKFATQAIGYGKKAVEKDSNNFLNCKWYAITAGYMSDFVGVKERIELGAEMRKYLEYAIALKPNDSACHHLLGRYLFNIYMLPWYQRTIVKTVFGSDLHTTAEEALASFVEAERLDGGSWKTNELFIAKCFFELKKQKEAIEWLEKAEAIPVTKSGDKATQDEISKLLEKHKK